MVVAVPVRGKFTRNRNKIKISNLSEGETRPGVATFLLPEAFANEKLEVGDKQTDNGWLGVIREGKQHCAYHRHGLLSQGVFHFSVAPIDWESWGWPPVDIRIYWSRSTQRTILLEILSNS